MSHLRGEFEFEKQEKHLFDVVQIKPFPKWEYVEWLESKVEKFTSTNSKSMPLPKDAVVDKCKRFDECPASGKGHAGCYSSVGCFL